MEQIFGNNDSWEEFKKVKSESFSELMNVK